MWSWSEREHVARTLAAAGYSFYLYAPKGDEALRRHWQIPFTDEWLSEINSFAATCRSVGMRFGIGFSPFGLQNDYSNSHQDALRQKLTEISTLNLDYLAILFDDMDAGTENLALIQARIVDSITSTTKAKRFIVCPSYYSDDVVLDVVFGTRPEHYLQQIGNSLDQHIDVFWTGEEVCSRQISAGHLERVAETIQRKPMLWDNYPVNDGARMSSHLHLRAFTGRDPAIASLLSGHAINPALQPTLGLIPALTLEKNYAEGAKYEYGRAFTDAAVQVAGEPLARFLQEDLLALQDTGLHRLDASRVVRLRERYTPHDHPVAREVIRWLNGEYAMTNEMVQTQ